MLIEMDEGMFLASSIVSGTAYANPIGVPNTLEDVFAYLSPNSDAPSDVKIFSGDNYFEIENKDGKSLLVDVTYFVLAFNNAKLELQYSSGDNVEKIALPIAFLVGAYDYLNDGSRIYVEVSGGAIGTTESVVDYADLMSEAISEVGSTSTIPILPISSVNVMPALSEMTDSSTVASVPQSDVEMDVIALANYTGDLSIYEVIGRDIGSEITTTRLTIGAIILGIMVSAILLRRTPVNL